ncbi:hypothetical protein RQP46_010920 [Phenoliferia psychrophenolica]
MSQTELGQLLGLDDATVAQQLWPMLSSLSSPGEVSDWLDGMLGPNSPFTSAYLSTRFPPKPAPPKAKQPAGKAKPAGIWGKTPSTASSAPEQPHPTNAGTSRAPVSEQERRQLEASFGTGGKVYIKNRDDEIWGGGAGAGKKSRGGSRGGSGSVTPTPPAQLQPTPQPAPPTPAGTGLGVPIRQPTTLSRSTSPAPAPTANKKGKGKATDGTASSGGTTAYDSLVDMSEDATRELLHVDRTIRELTSGARTSKRACFCQAREHPLSLHTPMCPSCALVLCTLNSPIAPCPSCTFSPLLAPTLLSSTLSALSLQRASIISTEATRIQLAREADERERAAIRFPSLDQRSGGGGPAIGATTPRGYANMAGAGPGLEERVERAMDAGVSVHGRPFGRRQEEETTQGKVLRLDMKTKKVKVQIRTTVIKKGKEVASVDDPDDADDGEVAWIDERDDGVTPSRVQQLVQPPTEDRSFFNGTIEKQPVWTEEVEIVEEELVADVEAANVEGERSVPGAKVQASNQAGKSRSRKKKLPAAGAGTAKTNGMAATTAA